MMEKLEAVKQAAGSELTKQKQSYEERLRDLEGTLVGVVMGVANNFIIMYVQCMYSTCI